MHLNVSHIELATEAWVIYEKTYILSKLLTLNQ